MKPFGPKPVLLPPTMKILQFKFGKIGFIVSEEMSFENVDDG